MRRALACLLLAAWSALWIAPAAAQAPTGVQAPTGAQVQAKLAAAREAIEGRRYDRALETLRAVIADDDVDPALRIEALILHARASAARGRLADADRSWRKVLAVRPDFEPAPETLTARARTRFREVRASVVGNLRLLVDPAGADVSIDGFPVLHAPDTSIALPTGDHRITASAPGFDPAEQTVAILGGREVEARLDLVPNAGALVLRTLPDGVTVRLDGEAVGVTSFSVAGEPAELRLHAVQLGERRIDLDKPCYRPTSLSVSVDANLLDRKPRSVGPIRLTRAEATLELRGGPAHADVFVDGERVGTLADGSFARCPGAARVEIRSAGRVLWAESVELASDADTVLHVKPRPNVALYGAEAWPGSLARLGAALGWRGAGDLPPSANPAVPQGWSGVSFASDTDLAVAFLREATGSGSRWVVMSPVLGTVSPLEATLDPDRPRWLEGDVGLTVVDSGIGGIARVVRVAPDGPAARAGIAVGDRILEVAAQAVDSARGFQDAVDAALQTSSDNAPLALRIARRTGGNRVVQVELRSRARFEDAPSAARAAVIAAWARLDSVTRPPEEAAGALANLAAVLSRSGWHRQAAATWAAAMALESKSLCRGTAAYERGVELEAQGPSAEASGAFRIAAGSTCPAFVAPEAPVAPAARARLASAAAPTSR